VRYGVVEILAESRNKRPPVWVSGGLFSIKEGDEIKLSTFQQVDDQGGGSDVVQGTVTEPAALKSAALAAQAGPPIT
jgi:hypothetical protein